MIPVFSLLAAVAPIAITVMLLVLKELSKRLGAVLKLGQQHRLYYVAACLTGSSAIIRLLSISFTLSDFHTDSGDTLFGLLYSLTLMSGVVLGLVITWRYWGWLVYASDGKTLL
jgi:hypothetical protein